MKQSTTKKGAGMITSKKNLKAYTCKLKMNSNAD